MKARFGTDRGTRTPHPRQQAGLRHRLGERSHRFGVEGREHAPSLLEHMFEHQS